ncbi:P-loop containing nucleoside triphosphate hydrolase protein [Mycena leptocephala]|nr:P-loop containing nucleoside triphosphate hydrolase protein [Mycena leptocephala]
MLPSQPKIFHGRDSELSDILHLFSQGTPRIAVLGTGGMGKTSLARAVIHHTEITERYNQHRFFVACDSAATQVELAALIGAHVGLKPGKDLTHPVIQYFSSSSDSLLILDNLETLWEPAESRGKIEEFLSLLTGVAHLALLITMRGAERPTKVAWTHPFLPLLKPLEQAAARQTFIDIADNTHDPKEVDKVLSLTDNMPLAISLIAHLADSEGCSHVLSHWEEEKTSLISDGYDRTSNLDLSISLSLSSPRLNPHSKDLLSLLSMLPDGLSDVELVQSKLPIDNILGCKAALIRTTLAYSDEHKRLKALVPIREYMQKIQPPDDHLVHPLLKHFQELLEFYMEYQGNESSSSTVARLSSNYSNIHNVLQNGLQPGQGAISLIQQIDNVLPHPHDHRLEAYFILECLNSRIYSISNLKTLASDALEHFKEFDDPDLKCKFYNCLANYYRFKGDTSSAKEFCAAAISLAFSTGNTKWHSHGLHNLAWVEWALGDYSAAQMHATEAQRLALISADLHREALALDIEASCCHTLGNYTKAMSLCIRARDLLGLCAMSGGTLDHNIMNTQAEVHKCKSEYVEARSIHKSILEETSIQDLYNYSFALLNVAEIDVMLGAPKDDVQRDCDRARKMLDTLGDVEGVILCDVNLADLHLREGNSLAAKIILVRCLKVSLEYSQIQTYCLERLGDASCWGGLDGMSNWTTVFLVHSLKRKENLGIYKALQFLGDISLSQNDEHGATSFFTVALEGFTEMDVHCSRAECMLRLGDISMGHGNLLKAVEFWDGARPLFERSSQAKQVQHINERVANISEDVLQQHRNNLAHLAELNAPAGTVEELEDDLSDNEDLDKMDMVNRKELGLIAA